MANLVVTSTTNSIIVVMNDVEISTGIKRGVWRKTHVDFAQTGPFITASILTRSNFLVSYGSVDGGLQIDSVDGVAPTSLDHLFTLLADLIA